MGRFLRASFDWFIYGLSFLMPRDPRLWIFIGWRRNKEREIFAENPKYEFLYVARHEKRVRPIWIGQDAAICRVLRARGFEAYPIGSLRGVYYSLRAGYTFIGGLFQSRNWRYAGRTRVIQLWHSKSLKKTGFNSPYGLTRYNRFLNGNLFREAFRFVAISRYLARFVTSDFAVPPEQLLPTGIPKHDALITAIPDADIDLDTNLDALIETARAQHPKRLILYGPTFRPDGTNPIKDLDFKALNEKLRSTGDRMIISLHPKSSTRDWIPADVALDRISFSQSDLDIYPVLHKFDVLITDYSSLTMDFLFLDKPLILYAFDMETFKEGMGVYEDLWELMPGPKVYTFADLLKALEEDLGEYAGKRAAARHTLFDATDGGGAKRITAAILSTMRQ